MSRSYGTILLNAIKNDMKTSAKIQLYFFVNILFVEFDV